MANPIDHAERAGNNDATSAHSIQRKPARKLIMTSNIAKRFVLTIALATAAAGAQAAGLSHAGAGGPFTDGARSVQDARNPYSDGARPVQDARNPYSDGARSVQDARNPYSDGARVESR